MDMCYDGALVMPSSYVVMDEEEMTYVEGGIGKYFRANTCATIATYVYLGGFGITAGTAIAAISNKLSAACSALGRVLSAAASLIGGVIGKLIVGAVCALAMTNMVSFLVNIVTADRKNTGCYMKWYGAGFGIGQYY